MVDSVKVIMVFDFITIKIAINEPDKVFDIELNLLEKEISELQKRENQRIAYHESYERARKLVDENEAHRQRQSFWKNFKSNWQEMLNGYVLPEYFPEYDEELFKYEKFEREKLHKLKALKNSLTKDTKSTNVSFDLESTEKTIKGLLQSFLSIKQNKFILENNPDKQYDRSITGFSESLLILCKYAVEIRSFQQLRKKQSTIFIKECEKKNYEELNRIIREYERRENPLSSVSRGTLQKDEWLNDFYNIEQFYLDDVILELKELLQKSKKAVYEEKIPKRAFEKEIKEIEEAIEAELQLQLSLEKLIKQHPQHEAMLRKRFRRILDSLRDKE